MIIIAHRGNLDGPSDSENDPNQIRKALDLGYHAEVDVWLENHRLFLGHNKPNYEIDLPFLMDSRIWAHAKTVETLCYLADHQHVNTFYQMDDYAAVTSQGYIWHHSYDVSYGSKSVATVLEFDSTYLDWDNKPYAICSDYAGKYQIDARKSSIKLLVIDIDGVMTTSKTYTIAHTVQNKAFLDKDFTAIKRFKAAGVNVCFLSGDHWNEGMAKARKVDFISSRDGDKIDKSAKLNYLCERYDCDPSEIVFIGDDYYDISLMEKVRAFCPIDAPGEVREVATRLFLRGGEGCIAQLYDILHSELVEAYPHDNL